MVESVAQSHAEIAVDSTENPKIRVLHVDDELGLLKVVKQCLELQGPFQVDIAGSVEEALNKLKVREYDAVVSDYQMPGKDGLEFLEMLRKNGNTIPFIMFTGKGREEVAVRAWNLGADHYVNKSGDPETVYCELAHCLQSTVKKHFAEAQMREVVQKLQAIYQNAIEGISYVDAEENIVFSNKAFADIVGYDPDQLAGMNLRRIVDDENWAKIENETKRRRQGESSRYEIQFRRSDGTARTALVSGAPMLGSDGRFAGTIGIVLDIADRKKAEDALRASEERYRVISSVTADFVFSCVKRGEGQFVIDWLAGSAKDVFGYSGEEVRERSCWKFIVQEQDLPIFEKKVTGLKRGQSSVCELRINHKDGSTRWIKVSSKVVKDVSDPTNHRLFGTCEDITERKQMEKQLKESEEKYRGLFENARDVIVLFDLKGNITSINKGVEKEYGFNRNEMLGKSMLKFVSKRHWPKLLKDVAQVALGKTAKGKVDIQTPNGTKMAEYESNPILSDNRVVGIQTVLVDITERERAEAELRESERRYNALIESINDVFFAMDRNLRYTYWNEASKRLTGISAKDAIGKSLTEVFPDVEGTKLEEFYRNTLRTNQHQTFVNDYWIGDKDFVFEIDAYPHKDGLSVFVKDVSERKKAEKALGESEAKHRDLFENAMDAIVTLDLNGRIAAVNNSVLRFGYKKEDLIGKNILDFVSKGYWPAAMKDLSKAIQGEPVKNEIELVVPTGKILGEYHARAILKEKDVVGVQINLRDMTERKKAEQALRESEERLRILFENAPDAFYISDLGGHFIDGNRTAEEVTGYRRDKLIGKSFLQLGLLPKGQMAKAAKLLALNALGRPTGPDEFVLNRKDGAQIVAEIRTVPTKIDGKAVVLGIARDITERKRNEELALENQRKFESLFVGNPEAIAYLGPDFLIRDVNPRFEELFGYSLAEIQGKHINDIVVPSDRRKEGEALDKEAGKGYVYRNTIRRKKDDTLVQVSVSAASVTVGNKVAGIVAIYHDISDLRNAEKKLNLMNEKLKVVGSLTRHDVRNKLTAVVGNTYLLRKRFASDPDSVECLESVEMAVHESERIFDFASAYEKLGVEQLAYLDAKRIFDEAAGLFPDLKDVRIVNDCGGLTLLADSLLRQLFYNLIDDSLKYGGKLTQIRIHYEKFENQLKLIYEDDGVGVSQDAKPKLFNEGFTTGKGSGYGLYLVKKAMEVYGWTIQETGTPNKGAQFTITIPRTNQNRENNYQLQGA